MKGIRIIAAFAALGLLQSCDKVEPPFYENLNSSNSNEYGYVALQGIPGTVSNLLFRDNFKTDSATLEATWTITNSPTASSGTVLFRWHNTTAQINGSGPAGGPVAFDAAVELNEGGLYGTLSFQYTAELSVSGSEKGLAVGYIYQKVLVEDYTGHQCGNCPRASRKAREFKDFYGDRLILLSVHAGFFASVMTSGNKYTYDFRTPAGTTFDNDFGISNAGNPNGMVNRKKINGNFVVAYTAWGSEANNVFKDKGTHPDAFIRIYNSYDDVSRNLDITVQSAFLVDLSGPYKLGVYLVEDSIINWQKDYDVVPEDVEFYVHRDALRGAVNTTYGEFIVNGQVNAETIIPKSYSMAVDPGFNEQHCSVIAFIFRDDTKEIIQVNERKIIE